MNYFIFHLMTRVVGSTLTIDNITTAIVIENEKFDINSEHI